MKRNDNKATVSVTVKFPKEVVEELEKEAKKKKTTKSALIKGKLEKADRKEETEAHVAKIVDLQNRFNRLEKEVHRLLKKENLNPVLVKEMKMLKKEINDLWQI